MYKQIIIFLLLTFLGINACAQQAASYSQLRHAVFLDGKEIGRMSDYVDCNMPTCGLYMIDTVYVLSKKIAVYLPVSLRGVSYNDSCRLAPDWTVHIEKEEQNTATLDFWSSVSSDFYRLEIRKNNSHLYISEELVFWLSSQYDFYTPEDGVMPFSALQILRKKVHKPINGVIVFDDFFDIENGNFESFHCPQKYSVEECLEMFNRGHKFTISDFEEE
ncbi:MAG: hypothetical protein LBI15_02355 [Dysgonamonadaceae bacterium]|jgi:hypothetical protein|nr:hypothetical protein [Dysgonamonadaceae bacterium]